MYSNQTRFRIVIVSSLAHRGAKNGINFEDINFEKRPFDTFEAYSESKLANILHGKELARRLEGSGISTYILHPGPYIFPNFLFIIREI